MKPSGHVGDIKSIQDAGVLLMRIPTPANFPASTQACVWVQLLYLSHVGDIWSLIAHICSTYQASTSNNVTFLYWSEILSAQLKSFRRNIGSIKMELKRSGTRPTNISFQIHKMVD